MQLLDHFLRRDANGTDKQLRFTGDDDIHELAELAVSIIVLRVPVKTQKGQATPERYGRTFVFLAFPPTCGSARSTPKGASLSSSFDFNSSSEPRSIFGLMEIPPMTPIPPLFLSQPTNPPCENEEHTAFVTAAASLGPAATYSITVVRKPRTRTLSVLSRTFIPASITGWVIPNSLVSGVENTGFEGGMVIVRFRVSQRSRDGASRGHHWRITAYQLPIQLLCPRPGASEQCCR